MKKQNRIFRSIGWWFINVCLFPARLAIAQDAEGIVNNGADYLIDRLGPGVFLIGIVITGISLASGNRNGVSRGIYTVIGGVVILAARAIFHSIQAIAN